MSPEELDQRVAVAECRVLVRDFTDGAAVRLEATDRHAAPVDRIGSSNATCQEGVDRGVGELSQVVAGRVSPLAMVMVLVADALEVEVAHRAHRLITGG